MPVTEPEKKVTNPINIEPSENLDSFIREDYSWDSSESYHKVKPNKKKSKSDSKLIDSINKNTKSIRSVTYNFLISSNEFFKEFKSPFSSF